MRKLCRELGTRLSAIALVQSYTQARVTTGMQTFRWQSTLAMLCASAALIHAQTQEPASSQVPTLSANTTVVLVPALVTSKNGEPVFSLKATDFTVTDDGVAQKLRLEEDSDSEPLALVVAFETGGEGAHQIEKYHGLAPLIEAVPGSVPHKIAVVGFGSTPKLLLDFTPQALADNSAFEDTVKNLAADDSGAAILDTLGYAVDLLRDQPPNYRRAILLISETHDDVSPKGKEPNGHLSLDQALRAVSDTNTTIYSFAFSSTGGEAGRRTAHAFNNDTPGPRHGCMGKEDAPETADDSPTPDTSSDASASDGSTPGPGTPQNSGAAAASQKRTGRQLTNQAADCLGTLLPPFALAKMAVEAGISGLRRNIPETVADLTGGEYYGFKKPKDITRDMLAIANHVPNRYVLSFQPQSPHPGLHAVSVRLKSFPNLEISARTSYWADAAEPQPK